MLSGLCDSVVSLGIQQCFSTVYYRYNLKKLTYEERKASLIQRLNALNSAAGADDDADEDED